MEAKMCTFYQPGVGTPSEEGGLRAEPLPLREDLAWRPGLSLTVTVPGQQGCGRGRHSEQFAVPSDCSWDPGCWGTLCVISGVHGGKEMADLAWVLLLSPQEGQSMFRGPSSSTVCARLALCSAPEGLEPHVSQLTL